MGTLMLKRRAVFIADRQASPFPFSFFLFFPPPPCMVGLRPEVCWPPPSPFFPFLRTGARSANLCSSIEPTSGLDRSDAGEFDELVRTLQLPFFPFFLSPLFFPLCDRIAF